MKKHLFLISCLALMVSAATALMGCSSSEEIFDEIDGNVKLNFTLQDEQGYVKTTFKEGENIVFDLKVVNNDSLDFIYTLNFQDDSDIILDDDLFTVYTTLGNKVGKPWDNMFCEMKGQKRWVLAPAHSTSHIRTAWYGSPKMRMSYPLCKFEEEVKIKKGTYFTIFNVKYKPYLGKKELATKKFYLNFQVK